MLSLSKRFFRYGLMAAVALASMGAPSVRASEPKDMLKLVPEDAWGFVMLRSLGTIDERAAYLKELLGIDAMPPQLTPMGLMMIGVGPGAENPIDMKSPVCIALMDVQKFGAAEGAPMPDPGKAAVLIAPAKDSAGLLKLFNAEEAKDGVSNCTVGGFPAFAAVKDDFVILGQNKDCVTRVLKSSKSAGAVIPESRVKVLTDSDVFVSIALGSVMEAYKQEISGFLQGMGPAMGIAPKDGERFQAMFAQMSAVDFSINIAKEGLRLRYLVEAKKGSDLEKMVQATKSSSESLLTVLPKEKYLLALGGMATYSEHAEKFGDPNMVGSMLRQMQAEGIDEKAVKSIDAELQKMLKNMSRTAICISALPEGGEDGMFGLTVIAETKDADGFVASVRSIWENAWKLSTDKEFVDAKEFFVHKADAETIGGAKVDTLSLKMQEMADKSEMDEDELKSFQSVMGKEIVFRFGAADSKHVVCTFGGGKARHEAACKAIKGAMGGSLAEDKGIASTASQLPSPRSMEGYIAVDNILQVAKAVAKVVGEEEEIPFDAPTLDAPVALSASVDGGVQRGDLFVPTKLIVAIKKMIEDQMKASAMSEFDEEDGEEDTEEDGSDDAGSESDESGDEESADDEGDE